jgi:serine/threonine-protein kinase
VDARTDVYAFGVMLQEMLTGSNPFLHRSGPPWDWTEEAWVPARSSGTASRAVPGALQRIVTRCLEVTPERRFASASELVSALEGASGELEPPSRAPWTARTWALLAGILLASMLVIGLGRWFASRAKGPVPTASATNGTASAQNMESSRSANSSAQQLYEDAMRSLHDGTGQEEALLKRAVDADPTFAAAYLRLWLVAAKTTNSDDAHQHLVQLESRLTPDEHALVHAVEIAETDIAGTRVGLDGYLERHPRDCAVWGIRMSLGPVDALAALESRALAADAACVPVLLSKAYRLGKTSEEEALRVYDACLEASPHAVECLASRAGVLDGLGKCEQAETAVRRWVEITPDSASARVELAGLLAGRGEPEGAVREALGDVPQNTGGMEIAPEVQFPMFAGDLAEVIRMSRELAAGLRPSAFEYEHFLPTITLVEAATETGDTRTAANVAADYLSRRSAWRGACSRCEAVMLGAAARGGRLDGREAFRRIAAAFAATTATGVPPANAWSQTYAYAVQTPSEATAAIAKLDELDAGVPTSFRGAAARALFLGGRGEQARAELESTIRGCSTVFGYAMNWVHGQLYLGELDERDGNTEGACAHYAKVLERWGHAKPRSVTADEARAHAAKLHCVAR